MGNFTKIMIFFTVYSFMGWVMEIIFAGIRNKRFTRRGFLRGPFCPIYGFKEAFI